MNLFIKPYQYINALSLDVAAGAVISALFFASIFDVPVSIYALAALALTVWIIYTLDHLRDAMTIPRIASTDRHRFHQKHFRFIVATLVFVMVLDFVLLWFVTEEVLLIGIVLWFVVLVYLLVQRYLKFMKELFVAALYTAGILVPSMALAAWELNSIHSIIIGKYFVTAWMNLLLFSLFDHQEDQQHQQHSFVTWFGPASTRFGILFLGLINILSGVWLWSFDPSVAVIFVSMNILLLTILFFQRHFISNNYYRIAGDAVFFIPVFYLL